MKKKLMGIISIVAVAAVAGYNMYSSRSEIRLSDLALESGERHLLKMLWLYGIGYVKIANHIGY